MTEQYADHQDRRRLPLAHFPRLLLIRDLGETCAIPAGPRGAKMRLAENWTDRLLRTFLFASHTYADDGGLHSAGGSVFLAAGTTPIPIILGNT
jgi:hypothetical protein